MWIALVNFDYFLRWGKGWIWKEMGEKWGGYDKSTFYACMKFSEN